MLTVLCGLLTLCGAAVFGQSDAIEMRRVIDAYKRVYSGPRAGSALASFIIKGTQQQGDVRYSFTMRKKSPDSIRFSLNSGDATVTCGYNGSVGWKRMERGGEVLIEVLEGADLNALRSEAEFRGPLYRYFGDRGLYRELLGQVSQNERTAYRILVKGTEVQDAIYFIDVESYFLLRRDLLNSEGEVVQETHYRKHRLVEGFPFAFEIENRAAGEQLSLSEVDSVEINLGMLDFYFEKPSY
ncbi:hypothetical protein Caka_1086 [Coraliomargarita akajimensis DSM 45221]|uniref:Outer membrane lipoprotein-sorting protein n=2 Tax=Coraliomargarita TaxID=442430 RepID=D5EHR6_CORAD|nr:hypothetical protein Caka_1086 [Coraliomargarita akajimensis DSM 45221]